MSQALYDLPEGWKLKKLGDLTTLITKGTTPTTHGYKFEESGINFIKIESIVSGEINQKTINSFISQEAHNFLSRSKLHKGDLLFSIAGSIGTAALVEEHILPANTNQALAIIRGYDEFLHAKFLLYVLRSDLLETTRSKSRGGALQNISLGDIKDALIPLPPLAEQTRIVEKLDAVLSRIDTAIDELQQSLALVDAMFKSGLDKAFNPLGSPTNEAGLYDLPDGWGWRQLHSITDVVSGYAFKSEDFSSDIGIPSVKITNVGLGAFVESQDDYLPSEFSTTHNKFSVKEGDIVIALTRPVINGGLKVCRVPKSYAGALVNQRVAAVMCNQGAVLEYVYWYLLSPMTLDYVVEKSKSLNQPNLSIKDLSKLEVPLPPLSEQQRVVEALDALNDKTTQLKTELTAKIDLFNQLKASVLDGAFRGEL